MWLGGKESACQGLIPGSGRSSGEWNGNPLQYPARRIPWTEEPSGLQSMGLRRVRHDSGNWAHTHDNAWFGKALNNHLWVFFKKAKHIYGYHRASLVAQSVKHLPAMQETRVWFLSWVDPLEKEMATHSSILAWRIPWTEEPGELQSMGSQSF